MFSLESGKLDPFVGIIAALSELQPVELALFQVLFESVEQDWPESIVRSVTHADGKPFFVNMPELAAAAENKVARPLYAAVVRIAVKSESFERTVQIARELAGSLRVFTDPQGNELIPLGNDDYPFEKHVEDVLCRQSRRSGMLLNSDELIGFVHLPSSDIRSPALERETGKTKAAPPIVRLKEGLLLGTNDHIGESVQVRLSPEQRVRHMHIIGSSGTGKSTLLFNLITQDIESGQGVGVLDPHGDLINRILGIIPPDRVADVVLVDPSDEEYSVGFNILSAHSELEKNLLASDLVSVFERLSTSWGDQMNSVLQNAILAFLESPRRGTLADLRRFLIEPAFRTEFLTSVQDSEVVYYWQKSFPHLSGNKSIGSILTRLDTFLSKKPIRHMVSQPENRLDFAHIMDTGKIFLAKLPEGLLGRENSYLLGTLLVSKFQQIAMSRQAQQIALRRDFWLYIDEFANFITPSMAEILSGARKYRIGLTLAHHELHQLQRNPEVASAVMSHPFTRVVFRVGDDDAKKLAEGFSSFEARDLRNLEAGQAIARVERSDYDFNLHIPLPEEPDQTEANVRRHEVITASRGKYARPRAEVEAAERAKLDTARREPEQSTPKPIAPPFPKVAETKPIPKPAEAPKPQVEEKPGAADTDAEDGDHTATKKLICREAEALDYTASIEELVPSGGRVDVVLRRGDRTIACEVSVTNTVEYEVANVAKCLHAGFNHVASVCRNRKKLARIQEALPATIPADQIQRVGFYAPDEFIARLFEWASADPSGGSVEQGKPKKQKISLGPVAMTEDERKRRENEMLDEIRRRMKGGPSS
jgi:hypothetical protein